MEKTGSSASVNNNESLANFSIVFALQWES